MEIGAAQADVPQDSLPWNEVIGFGQTGMVLHRQGTIIRLNRLLSRGEFMEPP